MGTPALLSAATAPCFIPKLGRHNITPSNLPAFSLRNWRIPPFYRGFHCSMTGGFGVEVSTLCPKFLSSAVISLRAPAGGSRKKSRFPKNNANVLFSLFIPVSFTAGLSRSLSRVIILNSVTQLKILFDNRSRCPIHCFHRFLRRNVHQAFLRLRMRSLY